MICNKCGTDKLDENFRSRPDKEYRFKICRSCEANYARNRRINQKSIIREIYNKSINKHKDRVYAYMSKYKKEHPDFVKRMSQKQKERNQTTSGKIRTALNSHNRRCKVLSTGKLSTNEWLDVLDFYGNKCLCCGNTSIKLTIDHIIPIHLGGTNSIDNVQPLCKSCNSKKHTKIIDYRCGLIYNRHGSLESNYREVESAK